MPATDTAQLIVSCKTQGQANLDRVNRSLTGMDGFAKKAIGTFAGFFAASKLYQFGKQAVGAFQETQDAAWKFSQTFSTIQNTAEKTFRNFQKTYGLSEVSARKMIGDTGDLLTGLGFSQEMALKFGDAASRLGTDLAGYTNYAGGAAGATMALVSAMTGENERAKALGIVIRQDTEEWKKLNAAFKGGGLSDADIKNFFGDFKSEDKKVMEQWEYTLKLFKSGKNLTAQQANAMTALALSVKQSKNAIGDWIKEGESFSQTMMNQRELVTDFSASFGAVIYDAIGLNDAMSGVNSVIKEMTDFMKTEGPIWANAFASVFAEIIGSVKRVGFFLEPIGSAFSATFKNVVNYLEWFGMNFEKILMNLPEIAKAVALDFIDTFYYVPDQIVSAFKGLGDAIWESIKTGNISESFKKSFSEVAEKALLDFEKMGSRTRRAMSKAGVSNAPEVAQVNYKAWGDEKYREENLKRIQKEIDEAKERADKRLEDRLTSGKNLQDTKKNADNASSALEKFNSTLEKVHQTAMSAIYSGTVDARRLQSRVFGFASGSAVNIAKGQEAKKTAESSVKTADNTRKMVALLERIAKNGGFETSTAG